MKRIKKMVWLGWTQPSSIFFILLLNKRSTLVVLEPLSVHPDGDTTAPAAYCDCHLNISRPVEWVASSSLEKKIKAEFFSFPLAAYYYRSHPRFYFSTLFFFHLIYFIWRRCGRENTIEIRRGERITSQSDIQWFHLNKTGRSSPVQTKQRASSPISLRIDCSGSCRLCSLRRLVQLFVCFLSLFFSIKKCCQIPLSLWFFFGSRSHQSRIKRPHWPDRMDRAIHWRHWISLAEKKGRRDRFPLFHTRDFAGSPFAFIPLSPLRTDGGGELTGIAVMKSCLSYCCDGAHTHKRWK